MKIVIALMLVAFTAMFGATQADADWFIDVTPVSTPTLDVTMNAPYSVEIGFNTESTGHSLGTYVFSLLYDTSEIAWVFATTTNTPPSPLVTLFGPPYESVPGQIVNFHGASFGSDAVIAADSRVVLATVGFDVFAPVGDGINDAIIDVSRIGTDNFTVDGVNYVIDTVDIRMPVVPEPISSTLFLIGGATLGFRHFVRRKK